MPGNSAWLALGHPVIPAPLCFSRVCPAPLWAVSREAPGLSLTFTINLGATCAEGPPPLLGTGQTDVEELWGKAEKASSCEQVPGASFLQPDAHHHPALARSPATGKREHLNPTMEGRAEAAPLGINAAETTGRARLGPSPRVSFLSVPGLRGENECSRSGLTPEPQVPRPTGLTACLVQAHPLWALSTCS